MKFDRTFGTIPGSKLNANARVVKGDGSPIENLYAAGELTAANAFSHQYPGAGIGISYAANSGRYATQQAASSIEK
ncbi:MAG: FAD-binding protein [Clostridiaceae bacterium]|nr:FAD-binding protein [Clostridiaceae bacterium]